MRRALPGFPEGDGMTVPDSLAFVAGGAVERSAASTGSRTRSGGGEVERLLCGRGRVVGERGGQG